jgi:hypothetical protein
MLYIQQKHRRQQFHHGTKSSTQTLSHVLGKLIIINKKQNTIPSIRRSLVVDTKTATTTCTSTPSKHKRLTTRKEWHRRRHHHHHGVYSIYGVAVLNRILSEKILVHNRQQKLY